MLTSPDQTEKSEYMKQLHATRKAAAAYIEAIVGQDIKNDMFYFIRRDKISGHMAAHKIYEQHPETQELGPYFFRALADYGDYLQMTAPIGPQAGSFVNSMNSDYSVNKGK
jgi:hypothetical protein